MTESLTLRPLEEGDMDAFVRLCENEEVSAMTGRAVSAGEAFRFSVDEAYAYALVYNGVFCGYASLFRSSITDVPGGHTAYEAAFALEPRYWGRGYGRQMLSMLLDEAVRKKAVCVLAGVYVDNAASLGLLKSMGFRRIFDRKDGERLELIMLKVL